jgi:ribosome recycling factor
MDDHIMIGTMEKNVKDTIVVQIRPFKEKMYLDIRNHYRDAQGELKPTQKGISIEVGRFNELKEMIDKAAEAIKKLPQGA